MVVVAESLAVDITLRGVAAGMTGLKRLEVAATRLQKRLQGTALGMLKVWAAFSLLTSQSAIAASITQSFGSVLGLLIDSILAPLLPMIDAFIDGLFAFSDWFERQGPLVKAAALAIGLAAALMWLGVSGPLALAIAGFTAFAYFWVQQGPVMQGVLAALAVAFGIIWAVATGGIQPLIAGIVLLIGWLLKVTGLLDRIKNFFGIGGGGVVVPAPPDIAGAASGIHTRDSIVNTTTTTNNFNIGVTTGGGARDAGLELQSQLALAQRTG